MGVGEQQTVKKFNVDLVAKVISAIALIIPLQYGLIFFMVEAKTESLSREIESLQEEARKGPRFTQHEGDRLSTYIDKHGDEISQIHRNDADMREHVAEVAVQQANVLYRLNRLEDLVQIHDHHNGAKSGRPHREQSRLEPQWRGPMDLCDHVPCLSDITHRGEEC